MGKNYKDPFADKNTVVHMYISGKTEDEIQRITGLPLDYVHDSIVKYDASIHDLFMKVNITRDKVKEYEKVIGLYTIEKPMTEIASLTGIDYQLVLKYVENYTLYMNGKSRPRTIYNSKIERLLSVDEYLEFVNNGFTDRDIAIYIGMSKASVINFKYRHINEIERRLNAVSDNCIKETDKAAENVGSLNVVEDISESESRNPDPIRFTAVGDSALAVVNLLMKMKDTSAVSMKDITDLSNLLRDADISTYTLQKIKLI